MSPDCYDLLIPDASSVVAFVRGQRIQSSAPSPNALNIFLEKIQSKVNHSSTITLEKDGQTRKVQYDHRLEYYFAVCKILFHPAKLYK